MTDAPATADAALMAGVIPYLAMAGRAAEACDFYARAFGATDIGRMPMPDGAPGLIHAQVAINGGALMMTDHGGGAAPSYGFGHLQLVVADGRAWWDRAVAAGCTVLVPYERQFWGDDWGLLADPFGIRWGIMQDGTPA
ncbi:MAG: VOC family protein [Acetobacteraceae bacterium]